MRFRWVVGGIALVSACVAAPRAAVAQAGTPEEVEARWSIFDQLYAKSRYATVVTCIELDRWKKSTREQRDRFFDRYADEKPAVVPYTECTMSVEGNQHIDSGAPAQFFIFRTVTWTEEGASARVSHHINGQYAADYHCRARKTEDAWTAVCQKSSPRAQ